MVSTPAARASVELAQAALARTDTRVTYDGAYRAIAYPNGDVPAHIGVCTDVVIRSLRTLGVDLQQLVHEDMVAHFDRYPKLWGLNKPDSNIDHRRVPNLETFFTRRGFALSLSQPLLQKSTNYQPGDIVSFRIAGKLPHIGIVGENKVPGTDHYYIIHNMGNGPQQEDVLFKYNVHGHFRYAFVDAQTDRQADPANRSAK